MSFYELEQLGWDHILKFLERDGICGFREWAFSRVGRDHETFARRC
jgi:hypothetical protein